MYTDRRFMSVSSWNKHTPLNYGREEEREVGSSQRENSVTTAGPQDNSYIGQLADSLIESFKQETESKHGLLGEDTEWGRRRRRGAKKQTRRRRFGGGFLSKVKNVGGKVKRGVKKFGRKLKGKLKGLVKGKMKKFLIKVIQKYIMDITGYDKKKFSCICTIFLKPYIPTGTTIGLSPSFTR